MENYQRTLSALAANRKQFFALIEALEHECACAVDEVRLTAHIDSHYDGRDELTIEEAHSIIMLVSASPGLDKRV